MPLLTLILIAASQTNPTWPVVPKWAVRSLDARFHASAAHYHPVSVKMGAGFVRTTEVVLSRPGDGELLTVSGARLSLHNGAVVVDEGKSAGSPKVETGAPVDVAVVAGDKDVAVYVNGGLFTSVRTPKGKWPMLNLPTLDLKLSTLGFATYRRSLSAAEIAKNAAAAKKFFQPSSESVDSKTVTLDLKLEAFTPVPDPQLIKPYRNALLAHEYTVVSLVSGHRKGLKPGSKVRVFRYGVWDGKKTAIDSMKAGDSARVTVELLSADPRLEREYQLDTLDTDVSAAYYVEVPGTGKIP